MDPRRFVWMPGDVEILFVPANSATKRFIRYPGQPRDEDGRFAPEGGGYVQSKGLNPRKSRVFAEKVGGDKQPDVDGSESVIARRMADETGFSGAARVVSRAEMDAAVAAGAIEAYRGVTERDHAEQLRTGTMRYSVGTHGSGLYVLYGPDAAAQAIEYASGERYSIAVHEWDPVTETFHAPPFSGNGALMRMALMGEAKVIDYEDLTRESMPAQRRAGNVMRRERESGDDEAYERAVAVGSQIADPGLYAMTKGYDAVRFEATVHQDGVGDIAHQSLIILNRTALLIQEEDARVPKAPNRSVARYPGQPRDESGQFASSGIELTKRQSRLLQQCRDTFTVDIFKAVLEVDPAGVADALDLNTVHEKDVEAIAKFVHAEAGRTLTERGFPSTMTVWRAGSVLPDSVESFTTHGGGVKQFGAAEPYWVARSDVLFDAEGFLGRMQSYVEDELLIKGSSVSAAKPTTERYPGQPRDEKGQFASEGRVGAPASALQAVEQIMAKAMPNASIDLSTSIPVDVPTIDRVATTLDAALARWPDVAPNVTSVRMTDAREIGTSILGVYVKADERGVISDPTTRMAINADEFVLSPRKADFLPDKYVGKDSQGRDIYESDQSATVAEWDIHLGSRVGWGTPGADLEFVVTHEVGHMVEAAYSPVVLDFMTSLRADYYEGLKPSSELASLGKDPEAALYPNFACRQNVHEWFADLFAMSERGLRPAGYEWQVDRTTELLSGLREQTSKPYAPVTTRHDPADSRYPGQPRDENGRWTSGGAVVGEAIEWKDEYSTLLPESVIPRLETGMTEQDAANGNNPADWLQGRQEEWKAKVGWNLAQRLDSPEVIAAMAASPGLGDFVSAGLDYATQKAIDDGADPPLGLVDREWHFRNPDIRYEPVPTTDADRAEWLGDPYVRYALTSGLLHQWAISSGDADALSIAIQMAAAREFDVPDTITNRYTDPASAAWREAHGADAYTRAKDFSAENDAGLRVILRGIYDTTQDGFRDAGITEVVVTRGITQLPPEVPKVDRLGLGIKVMEDPDGWAGPVTANPLTSWTVERPTARGFGDTHLTTRVPVERVFSTGAFGTGCVLETEVVLLGGEINTFVDRRWS